MVVGLFLPVLEFCSWVFHQLLLHVGEFVVDLREGSVHLCCNQLLEALERPRIELMSTGSSCGRCGVWTVNSGMCGVRCARGCDGGGVVAKKKRCN